MAVCSVIGESDVVVRRVAECLGILLNGIKSRERLSINFHDVFML
jgi:hypothetical protein